MGELSIRERQIPYDFTHMWHLMNKQLTMKMGMDSEMESRMPASGCGEVKGWRDLAKRKKLMDVDDNVVIAGEGVVKGD